MIARILGYLLFVAILVVVAVWFANHPGQVTIRWLDYRVDTSVGILVALVLVVALSIAVSYRVIRFVIGVPERIVEARRRWRQRRGYRALAEGMIAAAAGEVSVAAKLARRARGLVDEPQLTLLLSAQVAELQGSHSEAVACYEALRALPATELLGLRGLIAEAGREGDTTRALDFARRARAIKPDIPWVMPTLFDLEVRLRHWGEAEEALAIAVDHKAVDPTTGRQHKAAILLARSAEDESGGKAEAALECARKAHAADPAFVPAAARLARLLVRADKARRARRTIEETWGKNPHRDLLAPYREACGMPDALHWAQSVQRLAETNRGHVESRLALAEAALGAQLWGVARQALMGLVPGRPSDVTADVLSQACRLQATLEERENANADLGRRWRAEAAAATPDSVWQCDGCGAVSREWTAQCAQCAAFDRFTWRVPSGHSTGRAPPTAELPLVPMRLVGGDIGQRALKRGAG